MRPSLPTLLYLNNSIFHLFSIVLHKNPYTYVDGLGRVYQLINRTLKGKRHCVKQKFGDHRLCNELCIIPGLFTNNLHLKREGKTEKRKMKQREKEKVSNDLFT